MPPVENQPSDLTTTSAPAVEEIIRVSSLSEAVNRNLQITTCYWELSKVFAVRTGIVANWCTFATWASKQAGVTIRGEDMKRTLEATLKNEPEIQAILKLITLHSKKLGSGVINENIQETALGKLISSATGRASDAVARGNKKVFEEIGQEFARFITTCLHDDVYHQSTIDDFCKLLTIGPPPDGQDFLGTAFRRYYQSFYEADLKKQNELRFLANIEIGYHEQTRLQPEITESLNAGLVDPQHVRDFVTDVHVNNQNLVGKILYFFQWIVGKTNLFKNEIDSLVLAAEKHIRKVITKEMMTLTFPPANVIHLGRDLVKVYPEQLKQLDNIELVSLLTRIESETDSLPGDAATDWSNLNQRLHFIADLFRIYHETKDLFLEAFSSHQVKIIRSGGLPEGRL